MPRTKKTEEVKTEEAKTEFVSRPVKLQDFNVIKYIVATEKTNILRDTNNSIVLACDPKTSKDDIKGAVEAIFGAKVTSVNTINSLPKKRRVGRYEGHLSQVKKAIVKLDSSFDLGKIADSVASEEMQATKDGE